MEITIFDGYMNIGVARAVLSFATSDLFDCFVTKSVEQPPSLISSLILHSIILLVEIGAFSPVYSVNQMSICEFIHAFTTQAQLQMKWWQSVVFMTTLLNTQAKPEKSITLQDLLSSYISDFRAYKPDLDACDAALIAADANQDGTIQKHEYPRFVADLVGKEYIAVSDYDNLPFVAKLNFVYLSCLCEDERCCKGMCLSSRQQ
jgi:hypothetical protein